MADDFRVLDDRSHVLIRANVYLGSTTAETVSGIINYTYQEKTLVPALVKMIEEIYQNSVDEFIRTDGQFANKIDITFSKNLTGDVIMVKDNGRGIPQDIIAGKPRPVLAWTELRAGSNFDDSKRIGAGTNGMGAALANIFSTSFIGTTSDGKSKLTVTCSNNMEQIAFKSSKTTQQGTTVEFIPDLARFNLTELGDDLIDVIRDRIENLAICYKGIQFTFNGEKIKFKSLKDIAKKFSEHSITLDEDNTSLVIAPSGAQEEFRSLSYVNGLNVKNGGAHVDFILSKIIESVRVVVKKKYKFDVLPNQVKQHLLIAVWMSKFPALRFDSQSKERVTNTPAEVAAFFGDIDFAAIAKKVLNTPEIIDPIVEAQVRKAEAARAAELKRLNKDSDKANLRKIGKFTDATNKDNRAECMLMICEGLSASNSILSARTEMIGCYPLKGKPINAMAADLKDLLANKEFADLLAITGLKIGQKVKSVDDLRFGKLVVVSDADHDGASIAGLLLAMIKKFWPELFTFGIIYRFQTPIMKTLIGKEEFFFDTLEEFDIWATKEKKPFKTRYLKGLGSSTASDFRNYFDNMETRLLKITINDISELDIIDNVYGKEAGLTDWRKAWLDLE